MKLFFYIQLVFLILTNVLFGQSNWNFIDTKSGIDFERPKKVIPLVDEISGNTSVLLKYKKNSKFYLFDDNHNIISSFETEDNTKRASNYIGGSTINSKFTHFFKNNNNSIFEILQINYKDKTVIAKTVDLNLKKYYFIEAFEEAGNIYLLSIVKNSSILKIHRLNPEGVVKESVFDLSKESFTKFNGLKTSLYFLIASKQTPSKIQSSSIDYNVPNSLETTSSINKIYFKNGIISITNDNVSSHTNLIQINIETGNYTYERIPKKGFLKEELRSESNSFVLDNFYFSVYSTIDKLIFSIFDLETKTFVKEFSVTHDESISFKNTSIIETIGEKSKTKDKNASNRLLRNVINSNLGISVYKKDELYIISIGGSKKEQSSGLE